MGGRHVNLAPVVHRCQAVECRLSVFIKGTARVPYLAQMGVKGTRRLAFDELVKETLAQDGGDPGSGCADPWPCPVRVRAEKLPYGLTVSKLADAADPVRSVHLPRCVREPTERDLDHLLRRCPSRADRMGSVENA